MPIPTTRSAPHPGPHDAGPHADAAGASSRPGGGGCSLARRAAVLARRATRPGPPPALPADQAGGHTGRAGCVAGPVPGASPAADRPRGHVGGQGPGTPLRRDHAGRVTRRGPGGDAPDRTDDAEDRTAGLGRRIVRVAPGVAVSAVAVALASGVHRLTGVVPTLTAALLLGILAVNLGLLPGASRAGLRFAASRFMRAGVVLLGLQVALGDVAALGVRTIVMVIAVLAVTFAGTRWMGRRMGLPDRLSLLVAAGFSICGASAVAAVDGALGTRPGDRDAAREAATAVTLVTLCGTLAIAVLPPAGRALGLSPYDTGRWIGASVHDVGQVVATATIAGATALVPAVTVKLVRVAMLAPITAGTGLWAGRGDTARARRSAVLPLFAVGFLAMMAVRSTGVVPHGVLTAAGTARDLLFGAALFGLGSAVRLRELARTGHRALLLGLTSWALIAVVSYCGVVLTAR